MILASLSGFYGNREKPNLASSPSSQQGLKKRLIKMRSAQSSVWGGKRNRADQVQSFVLKLEAFFSYVRFFVQKPSNRKRKCVRVKGSIGFSNKFYNHFTSVQTLFHYLKGWLISRFMFFLFRGISNAPMVNSLKLPTSSCWKLRGMKIPSQIIKVGQRS